MITGVRFVELEEATGISHRCLDTQSVANALKRLI